MDKTPTIEKIPKSIRERYGHIFDFVFLGHCFKVKYIYLVQLSMNQNFHNLAPANKQLVGKIENEHSLFYHGKDQTKMKNHNMLPTKCYKLFHDYV